MPGLASGGGSSTASTAPTTTPRPHGLGDDRRLERDGQPAIGSGEPPALGRRWWAERGAGAWAAPSTAEGVDFGRGRAPAVSARPASTAPRHRHPVEGRARRLAERRRRPVLQPPSRAASASPSTAVMVAEGRYDASIIVFGGIWDFAATSLIVRGGGRERSRTRGVASRLDTATGVFTNPALIDDVLAVLAEHRPEPRTRPSGQDRQHPQAGPQGRGRTSASAALASMSARRHVESAAARSSGIVDERAADLRTPFVGVTTDGVRRAGLRERRAEPQGIDTRPIADAALRLPRGLSPEPARAGDVPDGRHRMADCGSTST